MKRRVILIVFALIVVIGSVYATTKFGYNWKFAADGHLEGVDSNGDVLVSRVDEKMLDTIAEAVVGEFNDSGVEIEPPEVEDYKKEWGDERPDIIDSTKTYYLNNDGKAIHLGEDIDVTVDDMGEKKTTTLAKIYVGEEERIVLKDPDYSQLRFMKSKNDQLRLLYTATGMWKVNNENYIAEKISKDAFAGRTYSEIGDEYYQIKKEVDGEIYSKPLFWNEQVTVDNDGNNIAYITNKDIDEFVGNSIWIYSVENGSEKRLVGGDERVFSILGWYTDDLLLVFYSENGIKHHAIVTLDGRMYSIDNLEQNFSLHDTFGENIVYQARSNDGSNFRIGKIDYLNGKVIETEKVFVNGVIIDIVSVNKNHDRIMAVYESKDNPTQYNIAVYDLVMKKLYDIECPVGYRIIKSQWSNSDKLLIVLMADDGNESTWIYSLEELIER